MKIAIGSGLLAVVLLGPASAQVNNPAISGGDVTNPGNGADRNPGQDPMDRTRGLRQPGRAGDAPESGTFRRDRPNMGVNPGAPGVPPIGGPAGMGPVPQTGPAVGPSGSGLGGSSGGAPGAGGSPSGGAAGAR